MDIQKVKEFEKWLKSMHEDYYENKSWRDLNDYDKGFSTAIHEVYMMYKPLIEYTEEIRIETTGPLQEGDHVHILWKTEFSSHIEYYNYGTIIEVLTDSYIVSVPTIYDNTVRFIFREDELEKCI